MVPSLHDDFPAIWHTDHRRILAHILQKPGRKRLTPYQLATKSSRLMMQQITRYELAQTPPDLLIQLCGEDYDMMEFYHAEEIIKAGRRAAKAALCR